MRRACVLALLLGTSAAWAQDDWALTRAPTPVKQAPSQDELAQARALALAGQHAEAAERFARLATKLPGSRAALSREAAREYLAAGQPEAALAWLPPGDDAARLDVLRKLGRPLEVEQLATALLKRAPGDANARIALAELRHAEGQHEQALALLAAHPPSRSVALHRSLRALYAQWGERAREERELQTLAELEPNDPAHRLAIADAALARGDRERARAEVLRAAALDGSAASEARAAELLADHDLLSDALAHVAIARQRSGAYQELEASLLERAGRLNDAERLYKQLLTTERAGEARRRLAGLWRRAGTLDAHVAELRTYDDLASLRLLAELYARDPKRLTEQRRLLARILERVPDDRDALRALALADREAGDLHGAIELAPRALEVDEAIELALAAPNDSAVPALLEYVRAHASARVWAQLAEVHRRRNELQDARAAYERSLAMDPRDEVKLAAGELELSLGQPAAQLAELLTHGRSESVLLRAVARMEREPARAALLAGAQQRVQRRVLLSLGEPVPGSVLHGALLEGDERERMQALEQLRARPDPALVPLLRGLVARVDRPLAEREAALRALPITPALYATLPRALRPRALARLRDTALLERERSSPDRTIRAAAELALASDDALASRLLSERPEERRAAAEVLAERVPWAAVARAAEAHPGELVPYGPGVVPRALLEIGACPKREDVLAFSAALLPALRLRREVALLVHAGGAEPDTLRALDRAALHSLLVELAARSELPPGAAEALLAERARREWPERLWATRALGTPDEHEPLELVRTPVSSLLRVANTCSN